MSLILITQCESCGRVREVHLCSHRAREFWLCVDCSPKLDELGDYWLRLEHYADRGGVIYGAPWWEFNTLTEEDVEWERETFGDGSTGSD